MIQEDPDDSSGSDKQKDQSSPEKPNKQLIKDNKALEKSKTPQGIDHNPRLGSLNSEIL